VGAEANTDILRRWNLGLDKRVLGSRAKIMPEPKDFRLSGLDQRCALIIMPKK